MPFDPVDTPLSPCLDGLGLGSKVLFVSPYERDSDAPRVLCQDFLKLLSVDSSGLLAKEAIGLFALLGIRQFMLEIGDEGILDQIAQGPALLARTPFCQFDDLFFYYDLDFSLHVAYSTTS